MRVAVVFGRLQSSVVCTLLRGWVESRKTTADDVRQIMTLGDQNISFDAAFDARKVLIGNGWTELYRHNTKTPNSSARAMPELFPGDLVLYSANAIDPPDHIAMIVSVPGPGDGHLQGIWNCQVISKFGKGGEFLHNACSFATTLWPEISVYGDRGGCG